MDRIVTLEEAKLHLRVDTDAEDSGIDMMILAASQAVQDYITIVIDEADVPSAIKSATLLMIGYLYRERDGSIEYSVPDQYGYGYLPRGVVALLYPYRLPSLS